MSNQNTTDNNREITETEMENNLEIIESENIETVDNVNEIEVVEPVEVKDEKVVEESEKEENQFQEIVIDEPVEEKVHLERVLKFAEKFSSTGAAFLLATLGIITQTFHNGFLFFELSSFDNFWLNLFQTMIGAFGLSGALLYFTIRAANGGGKVVNQLVYGFFIFEIFANLYYWSNKLIIQPWGTDEVMWSSMIIAVPFAIMIPFTIKAYAGELNFKKESKQNSGVDNSDTIRNMAKHINSNMDRINQIDKSNKEVVEKIENLDEIYMKNGENINIMVETKDGQKVLSSTLNKKS